MRSIAPRTGAPEATIAEDQPEYMPLTVCAYSDAEGHTYVLSRWRPSREELARMVAGEDLYVSLMTGGGPVQPISVQVGPEGWLVDEATGAPADEPAARLTIVELLPTGLSHDELVEILLAVQHGPQDEDQVSAKTPLIVAVLPSGENLRIFWDSAAPRRSLGCIFVLGARLAGVVVAHDDLVAEPELTLRRALAAVRAHLDGAAPDSTPPAASE